MKLIDQNPFRTLGIDGSASIREIQKQIAIIKRYAEIGQNKSFPLDLEFLLGKVQRDPEAVQRALGEIEQAFNKVKNTLLWYYNGSAIDETALTYLSNEDIAKAKDIWIKVTSGKEITLSNVSSFLNLSTLRIEIWYKEKDDYELIEGILAKGRIVSSEIFTDFIKKIAGDNIVLNPEKVAVDFCKGLIGTLKEAKFPINGEFIKGAFNSFPSFVLKEILKDFTETPILEINKAIQKSASKRELNPEKANEYARELSRTANPILAQLKDTLGNSHLQVVSVINAIAEEILECSIAYFNDHHDDEDFDPGEEALALIKIARNLVSSGAVRNRIDENMKVIDKWVQDAPQRKIQEKIGQDMVTIGSALERFQNLTPSVENVENLLNKCVPSLNNVKYALGQYDELFIKISSTVANNALGMLIELANSSQNDYQYRTDPHALFRLFARIKGMMSRISTLSMDSSMRSRFNTNQSIINDIHDKLQMITTPRPTYYPSTPSSSPKSGCYIATMAYGSYDHPQVIILRRFRDEILSQSLTGRLTIKMYYFLSPRLVKLLSGHESINKAIRNILDKIINQLNS